MRVQYCSDLHLEIEQNSKFLLNNPLNVSGDVLVLAGDIAPLHDEFLNNPFFHFISDNFKHVFWVPGNHEYYHRDINDYSASFNIKLYKNISLVNNVDIQFEGIHFIFSTLWSRISEQQKKIAVQNVPDFEFISRNKKKFSVSDFNELHEEGLLFVKNALKKNTTRCVVVTHHAPSLLCISPKHKFSPVNEAFCVDLTNLIKESNAGFWIYGHNHFNKAPFIIDTTICLTNQLGYTHLNECTDFKGNAFISV